MTEKRLNEIRAATEEVRHWFAGTPVVKLLDELLAEVKPETPTRVIVPKRPWKEGDAAHMDDGDVCTCINELDRRINVLRDVLRKLHAESSISELHLYNIVQSILLDTEPEQ